MDADQAYAEKTIARLSTENQRHLRSFVKARLARGVKWKTITYYAIWAVIFEQQSGITDFSKTKSSDGETFLQWMRDAKKEVDGQAMDRPRFGARSLHSASIHMQALLNHIWRGTCRWRRLCGRAGA